MQIQYETELPSIEQYSKLFKTTGWNDEYKLSDDELCTSLFNSYYRVAAYDENKLVGFGRLVSDGVMHAMIYDLIVDPDYQQKGIGAEILKRLVDKCLANNIRDIQLFCAKGKRAFYEKRNFIARNDDAPGMQYQRN